MTDHHSSPTLYFFLAALTACVPQKEEPGVCLTKTAQNSLKIELPAEERLTADWQNTRALRDLSVGVAVEHPEVWTAIHDQHQFPTYGFVLVAEERAIARIARDPAGDDQLEAIVQAKIAEYPGVEMKRSSVVVDGRGAITLGPVPGAMVSTNVYVAAHGHVYRINYYGETLDADARALLEKLKLEPATRAIPELKPLGRATIGLKTSALSTKGSPDAATEKPCEEELAESESAATAGEYQLNNGCWAQPTGFFIQTSHSWDANGTGWSQMGTPNFWGDNTHGNWGLGRCTSTFYTNDLYAIDYYLDSGDRLFSPFARGYVQYAGWDPENWWNYGYMVVISSPSGKYWSLSAHLSGLNVSAGDYVTDETVIGWAGSTGYADPYPHVHQAFYRWPSSSRGRPYGGQGLRQTALSYLGDGGGTYTNFFKGKWVSW